MDIIDFRVFATLAIGHDAKQTIVFRNNGRPGKSPENVFDGNVWRAVRFIHCDKAVLIRDLRELGCSAIPAEALAAPDDLRQWHYRTASRQGRRLMASDDTGDKLVEAATYVDG